MLNRNVILLSMCFLVFACRESTPETQEPNSVETPSAEATYPSALDKVFEAHGGLDSWKAQRTLKYSILRENGEEIQTTDLWNRFDKIELPDALMGYDGEEVWLVADSSFERDPVFYHNLMFYFYAMPFVLADDGIIYSGTDPVEFGGISYPGIKISYEEGVGVSAKDEYILYYHPETFQMAWLGYTVTYFSGEKTETFKWIRYDDWTDISGLLLPKSISWYQFEDGVPTELRNTVEFADISLSKEALPVTAYQKPDSE